MNTETKTNSQNHLLMIGLSMGLLGIISSTFILMNSDNDLLFAIIGYFISVMFISIGYGYYDYKYKGIIYSIITNNAFLIIILLCINILKEIGEFSLIAYAIVIGVGLLIVLGVSYIVRKMLIIKKATLLEKIFLFIINMLSMVS